MWTCNITLLSISSLLPACLASLTPPTCPLVSRRDASYHSASQHLWAAPPAAIAKWSGELHAPTTSAQDCMSC